MTDQLFLVVFQDSWSEAWGFVINHPDFTWYQIADLAGGISTRGATLTEWGARRQGKRRLKQIIRGIRENEQRILQIYAIGQEEM